MDSCKVCPATLADGVGGKGRTLPSSGAPAEAGGAITNDGTLDIAGSSSINSDQLANSHLTIESAATLTLNGSTVTGGAIDNSGILQIEGSTGATLDGVLTANIQPEGLQVGDILDFVSFIFYTLRDGKIWRIRVARYPGQASDWD